MRSLHALLFLVVACSSKEATAPPDPPVQAIFGPKATSRLSPFPSDRYTKPDPSSPTGLRVDITVATTNDRVVTGYPKTVADLNTMDGFSTVGGIYVNFTGDVDPASFTRPVDGYTGADAPAALVDVDDQSPDKGKTVGLLPMYASTADGLYDYTVEDHTLLFQPARPLRPRTKYLFVVTSALKTRKGVSITATDDTRATLTNATDPHAERARAGLPILEKATGITRDKIVLISHFTTATVHEELLAAATARRSAPAPKITSDFTVVEESKTDNRVRYSLKFEAPEYRTPKPGGRFVIESGKPTIQATVNLEALLAFSDRTKGGKRPVVIFGHGLGGDKDGVWGTAERLSELNVAVISIDAPEHGSRGSGATDNKLAPVFAFFGIDAQTKDESFVIARARDNFRQMALDQLEIVRLIKSLSTLDLMPIGAPDGVPDLDTDNILYLGHSFGSVMGPTVAALAPEIRAACWNVGGAGLTTLLRDSPTFKFIIDAMKPAGTPPGDVIRFFASIQGIVDAGDAVNWVSGVTLKGFPGVPDWKARDVLLQEVYQDSIVPNSTSELLARAGGLTHQLPKRSEIPGLPTKDGSISANLPTGSTGVIAQFEHGMDGKLIDHGSLIFAPEGRAQYVAFFKSALMGRAVVPPPFSK
jgi:pimeloyl-ACP methyl ester carboxylesterase